MGQCLRVNSLYQNTMFDRKSIEADDGERPRVDRRSYLKGIAATAAIPAAAGVSGASSDSDYEEIVVSAHDTFTKQLSNGETWGNVVIDISARGAKFRIRATGNDWTIRNVGIRGVWDDTSKDEPIILSGNGRVENFYWADGTNWTAGGGAVTGMFVPPSHSGRIVIENANFRDFGDNAVYASSPGNPSDHPATGSGGQVIIRNSYASECTPAGFRLGTDGSKLENCVMHRNYRNFWAFFQHTELVDCDLSEADGTGDISNRNGLGDIVLGDSSWSASDRAEVTAQNTYWETEGSHGGANTSNIHGSSADRDPRTDPSEIDGLPLSAEEAASGSSGSSPSPSPPDNGEQDDEDDSENDDEPTIEDVWEDHEPNHVELERASGWSTVEYRLGGHGDAETGDYADTNSDDPYRDTAETNGDEFVVEGYLGSFRDDFYISGAVGEVNASADVVATVNGHEFALEELEGVGSWEDDDEDDEQDIEDVWLDDESNHVELSGGSPEQIAEYKILGSGDAESGENADTDPDDPYRDVATTNGDEFLVEGYLGGHVDDFYITGAVTEVDTSSELVATVNGYEFDLEELEGVGSWEGDDDDDDATPPHALVIDGSEATGTTDYSLTVSGEIVQSEYDGATIDDGDKIDGNTASGTVDDGRDAYWFSGDITDFWLAGEAAVDLEYNADE